MLKNSKVLFYSEGFPSILQFDNGLEFKNLTILEYFASNNICQVFGRSRHLQSQDQIEQVNQPFSASLQ